MSMCHVSFSCQDTDYISSHYLGHDRLKAEGKVEMLNYGMGLKFLLKYGILEICYVKASVYGQSQLYEKVYWYKKSVSQGSK